MEEKVAQLEEQKRNLMVKLKEANDQQLQWQS